MTAIEFAQPGGPEVLRAVDRPVPGLSSKEIRIRVKAAGVARADLLQRQGKYPPPAGASDVPGLDVAGIVDAIGPGVTTVQVGDEVCAILAGGGYAEYCSVPAEQVLPIPQGWSFLEAATLPENLFTVYDNLVTRAGLHGGESVLIHGGASGIGTMAIMLAQFLGAAAFVTAGSAEKASACLKLGAELAINYKSEDFVEAVRQKTDDKGVDVILDMVGGPYLARNLQCLALDGRLAVIATQGGSRADLDLVQLLKKRARILGSTMRARTAAEKGAVAEALRQHVWPSLAERRTIRPIVDATFPLLDAAKAHARLDEGGHIGKIILTV